MHVAQAGSRCVRARQLTKFINLLVHCKNLALPTSTGPITLARVVGGIQLRIGLQGLARRMMRPVCAGAAVAVCASVMAAGAARAASDPYADLTINSTMRNSYRYSIGGGPLVAVDPSPDNAHVRVGANNGGFLSEVGIDLTSSLAGDSFAFLHNGYCVGTCSVRIDTVLTFDLVNSGDTKLELRWDSLITPGHMAQIGSDGSALFHLIVVEGNVDTFLGGAGAEFRGETHGWYDQIDTGTGFSGFDSNTYSEGPGHFNARYYADWSATAFSLNLLQLTPRSTTQLSYYSWVEMNYADDCTDLSTCGGVQVAFGDPRNSGTVKSFAAPGLFSLIPGPEPEPYIGRQFDPYVAASVFVDPLEFPDPPESPLPLPRVTYTTGFTSQAAAVPEPSSWAMLICGFGAIGVALRRGRSGLRGAR
jgi:hypothetical protein